jgi:multidrug efflux pump
VVGGLFFATGLTLYVVPVMYSYFATAKKHSQKQEAAKKKAVTA